MTDRATAGDSRSALAEPLWSPSPERAGATRLASFLAEQARASGGRVCDAATLQRHAIADPARFWADVWRFTGIKGEMGPEPHIEAPGRVAEARLFPRGGLNFAENLLLPALNGTVRRDSDAIVFRGERDVQRRLTWGELVELVGGVQRALAEVGVTAGERVAAVLPNLPEAIAGMLGTASIGAVWSSCSPDFGVQGVLDRFGQIEPRVLIAADGYFYAGKRIDIADKLAEILAGLPTVERVIIVSYIGSASAVAERLNASSGSRRGRAVTWDAAVAGRGGGTPSFRRQPFDHPLYILFSSGTTGVPKCIVHSAGGTLLKHVAEHQLHSDVRPGDRLFYFTTLGWMMWNWLASGLSAGATLMLYDGSPFHPDGNVLWDFAAEERFTHFGTSAKYIDSMKKAQLAPARTHRLDSLRAILSTGSPLVAESFDYVYSDIKADVHLASISGGTDIVGCFVLGNPMAAVWRGEIQGPAFGLDVDVLDADGKRMPHGKGELVCRNPFPSRPIGFWNDPDGKRYRKAYYERFENTWHHGDFAEWTSHGGMIIHGRSDATLNPGGVRIGTAEIYRQVEQLPEVREAIVIGQDVAGDVRVVLFVVLEPGRTLDEALRQRIRTQIRTGASPRHVPARIVQVPDIPRTKSGKITELAVRDVVMGRPIGNKEALANPEALEHFRNHPDLKD